MYPETKAIQSMAPAEEFEGPPKKIVPENTRMTAEFLIELETIRPP